MPRGVWERPQAAEPTEEQLAEIERRKAEVRADIEARDRASKARYRPPKRFVERPRVGSGSPIGAIDDPKDKALAERLERARLEKERSEALALGTKGDWTRPGVDLRRAAEHLEPEGDVGNEETRKSLVERFMERKGPTVAVAAAPPRAETNGHRPESSGTCPDCGKPFGKYRRCFACHPKARKGESPAPAPPGSDLAVARRTPAAPTLEAARAEVEPERVDHPPHYNAHPSGVECIDVVEHMGFNVGNAMKYLWRADHNGVPIEDLRKARWYIDREIQRRRNLEEVES
jgi:hypothetical protein